MQGTIDVTSILLHAQAANLRALLAYLPALPEEHRASARAGAVQALGALEDALGMPRTIPRRDDRRRERVEGLHDRV